LANRNERQSHHEGEAEQQAEQNSERVARCSDLLATFFINIGTGQDREPRTSLDCGRQQHEQAEREEQG
jgi:hypothetical protein